MKIGRSDLKTVVLFLAVCLATCAATAQAGRVINGYGGMGVCVVKEESSNSKVAGLHFTGGIGRKLIGKSEVVLKGTFMTISDTSPVSALGLYFKMNFRRRGHKSWLYIIAGGGGFSTRTWRTTTGFYCGTGLGGILNTGDTRKLNLELRGIIPINSRAFSYPYVLLTIGVAL